MGVEDFLERQASQGELESKGGFTLDLSKAAHKLAAFALPTSAHYLLKIVQVAHHLRAEEINIKIERFRTVVRFGSSFGGSITDSERIYRAFFDPLSVTEPVMKDLVSALVGTITDENLETLWSYSQGHTGQRLYIDTQRKFSIKDFVLTRPKEDDELPYQFTLSVLHPKSWKFWVESRRRANAAKVLQDNCRFSAARIRIDKRELRIQPCSVLNDHFKAQVPGVDHRTFKSTWFDRPAPACNILFEMATPDSPRFCLLRPSLSAYVVRGESLNLWASGIRVNNTLKPDGLSSAAWMLQFRQADKELSIRHAPKRVPCQTVLALNLNNEGKELPLFVRIIRQGVTVLEQTLQADDDRLKTFQGCSLIFADTELETDLTGFQIIQDQAFLDRVYSFAGLVPIAKRYFQRGSELLTM